MFKGLFAFVLRGNVVDLAVAVVIGAAFTGIVNSLVKDLLTPLIAALVGKPDFSGLAFTINGSVFHYGNFINALVAFLLVAITVYYVIVTPMERILAFRAAAPTVRACPECTSEIPLAARRCKFCTAIVATEPTA